MKMKPVRPSQKPAPKGYSDAASLDEELYVVKKRILKSKQVSENVETAARATQAA